MLVELGGADVRGIAPTASKGATVLVDRHYTSLQPYHRSRPNLYLVQLEQRLTLARVSLLNGHLVVQPCDHKCEVSMVGLRPSGIYFDYVVGRVCQLRAVP